MDRPEDTDDWAGGFYELAVDLGDSNPARLEDALRALRECAGMTPSQPITASAIGRHIRGMTSLAGGQRIVCGTWSVQLPERDHASFYLPLGALARIDPRVGGYPFEPNATGSLTWRRPLDAWLRQLAERVFAVVPFVRGAIGFEADDALEAGVSDDRWCSLLIPEDGALSFRAATR